MKQIFAICLTALILTTIPFTIQKQIIHKSSGLCLDAQDAKILDGTKVILWKCHGGANQNWMQSSSNGGKITFTLKRNGSSKVMDVQGGSKDNGAKIIIWGSHGGDNQKWYWDGRTGSLKNVKSGKCLDVSDNNASQGLQLQQWTCNGSAAQRFIIQ